MTWGGIGPSGEFYTINHDGSTVARVDYEPPRGDVSGVVDNLLVTGLQGRFVSPLSPINGYILTWDAPTQRWIPAAVNVSVSGALSHDFLSTIHPDTIPAAPVLGDLVTGSGVLAKWARLPRGDTSEVLSVAASGDLEWRDHKDIPPLIVTTGASVSLSDRSRRVIVAKTIGSATLINLPSAPFAGLEVIVKDGKGDAGSPLNNRIDIVPSSGITIDGRPRLVIGNSYGAYTCMWNGTEWNII